MDHLEERLKRIFVTIFPHLSPNKIETADVETVETWDSVAAITLINLLEEEFGIEIDLDRASELRSFSEILGYLKERGVREAS